jgi:hypothetical protein
MPVIVSAKLESFAKASPRLPLLPASDWSLFTLIETIASAEFFAMGCGFFATGLCGEAFAASGRSFGFVTAAAALPPALNAESGASRWCFTDASTASLARPGDTGFSRKR